MTKLKALLIGASATALVSYPGSFAIAQSALSIGDNDSVLIDGTSFKVLPGKAKGDASTLIRTMGAQALGPGAVIFRSGDKLYIADAGPLPAVSYGGSRNDYGGSRNDYGGSRNDYGGSRNDYGGSRNDYGGSRNDYGGSRNDYGGPRNDYGGSRNDYGGSRNDYGGSRNDYGGSRNDYGGSRNDYGGSRNDYASDRSNGERVVLDDPDYAQYKLRRMFIDHWAGPKGETYLGVQDQFLRDSNGN
jgi:hypothetical protein